MMKLLFVVFVQVGTLAGGFGAASWNPEAAGAPPFAGFGSPGEESAFIG